jgi:hypothetical protein
MQCPPEIDGDGLGSVEEFRTDPLAELEAELGQKLRSPERRHLDRTVRSSSSQPAELEQTPGEGSSEGPGDVPPPLAPVETGPDEHASLLRELADVDPQLV